MYGKLWGLGFAFIFCLALMGSAQAAGGLKLAVTPSALTMYGNSSAIFQITLENQGPFEDEFIISVTGKPGWINLDRYYVKLPGGESADVNLMLSPLDTGGVYLYEIEALSMKNPGIKESKTVYLTVLPQEDMPIVMESFEMERDGNELRFRMGISSHLRKSVTLDFTVKDSSGNLVTGDLLSGEVEGLEFLTKTVRLPEGLLAGNYNVVVSLREMELSQMAGFSIEAVRDVNKKKTMVSNILFEDVTITVSNRGNVAEEGYRVTETLPTSLIVSFVTPARCALLGTDRECIWALDSIEPGGEASVTYRIEYWPLILIWGIVAVAIILIAVGTAKNVVKPSIRKKAIRKGRGRYTIVLEVRNPFYHTLSSVLVRDWLTPLGRVKREFRGPKPVIRSSEAGTELIWRLGSVKPRDEIIIHYEIKTVVHGQLKMPPASVKYATQKGGKAKVYSRGLVID